MKLAPGVYVPMLTPFAAGSEALDLGLARDNAQWLGGEGVAGLMPMGSNGEYHSLDDAESISLLGAVRDGLAGRKLLLCGVSRESAHATVAFVHRVADVGVDAVFAITPSYFAKAVGADGLIRYYEAVAEKSPLPLLLYAAPGYAAGVELPSEVARRLAAHPNIVGMKDTSGQPVGVYDGLVSAGFGVLAGSQVKLMDWLDAGALGGVLSSANFAPALCCRALECYFGGAREQAVRLESALRRAGKSISGRFGVAGVKAAAALVGHPAGVGRNPLAALGAHEVSQIEQALTTLREETA